MAIVIVNLGTCPDGSAPDPDEHDGERLYLLRAAGQDITQFTHRRSDGLATCLRRAADAAERAHEAEITRLIEMCDQHREP